MENYTSEITFSTNFGHYQTSFVQSRCNNLSLFSYLKKLHESTSYLTCEVANYRPEQFFQSLNQT